MKKKIIFLLTILVVILTLLVITVLKFGNLKIIKNVEIYKYGKIIKENDIFKYTNKWKFSNSDVHGKLTIKYDEENHTISRNNEVSSGNIKEFAKRNKSN